MIVDYNHCWKKIVCMSVYVFVMAYPFVAFPADISIKGIRLGMHIERARERMIARTDGSIDVSEILEMPSSRHRFNIGKGDGHIEANSRERVELISLSPQIVVKLFGDVGSTKEEFAALLSAAWALEEAEWKHGIDVPAFLKLDGPISYIQCQVPSENITVTVYDGNGLVVRINDPRNIKKRIQ